MSEREGVVDGRTLAAATADIMKARVTEVAFVEKVVNKVRGWFAGGRSDRGKLACSALNSLSHNTFKKSNAGNGRN